jgi:large subunit ribosomal protein L41
MRPTLSMLAKVLLKPYRKNRPTTKDINKGFYKGTRTGRMGRHTKYGGYRIDWSLVRTYVVPTEWEGFKVSSLQQHNFSEF